MTSGEFFQFTSPQRTEAGLQALDRLPNLLRSLGLSKPLLITDMGVRKAGLTELISSILQASGGMRFADEFDSVPPDSDTGTIADLARYWHAGTFDCLLALGGGSVIDTAKAGNILISTGKDDLYQFQGYDNIPGPLKPLIVIPTTAGTGSEATSVSVIKDAERHRKLAFCSPWLVPTAAVLDPRMTMTLSKAITAATGMDALAHAVESYIGLAKNPFSDSFALRAVELISKFLPVSLKAPHDREARLQMLTASHLAGIAFSNSMVSLVHTIGHCAGAVCGIPHGVCMGILLPEALRFNLHRSASHIGEMLLPLAGRDISLAVPREEHPERFILALKEFRQHIHELSENTLPLRFCDIRDSMDSPVMTPEHMILIAREAAGDPSRFYNPEDISEAEIHAVLKASYWGYSLDQDLVKKGHQK